MIGDVLLTKHFGTYVEKKDINLPAIEIVGKIIVRYYGDSKMKSVLFVEDRGDHKPHLYDVPIFLDMYEGHKVALLGRLYRKEKNGRFFDKLIVISVKTLK